ncbi:SEC14-like protein 5 [Salvia hispanica]|uniref:SEC14-like protein 5 n=1 Tax=Salvia hispanica TaxID=49212 RepID=UPI00200938AB|nr:SEC14-like protein 5 [Salvia hispanica]
MAQVTQELINQLEALMEEVDESLKKTFQNVHQGYPHETFTRFLKAREGDVQKARKMLVDCLEWRVQNDIDNMLAKPIVPEELYRGIRDSQLVGLSGYSKEVSV